MAHLNTLLLHPDPEVRGFLREFLKDSDLLKVLGEAVSAFEALELLEAVPYGVFFLGVDLPDGVSGFELAQMLTGRRHKPALVFIAKDESLAFTAFELGAADYLLWPASNERLERTMERLKQFKAHFKEIPVPTQWRDPSSEIKEEETLQLPLGEDEEDKFLNALSQAWRYTARVQPVEIEKLPINMDGRTILIPYTQIIFVEAYEDYSYVHTANQKFLTSYRLKNLEDRLRQHRFFRVHRKYLVNLDMVTEIASLPGANFMLRTAGKTRIELPISRRRIAELKQILGL
ncbi:MAG: LytTR family DNA-binding domain-containing protein [Thermodesulfobacteriota bacterium]|nr:LytTR family DNA-binding domain-containing protein [Thermodesulfobacteriota bacterium]